MDPAHLGFYRLMGNDKTVTNKIRQVVTNFVRNDDFTEAQMTQLSSREEFGLSPAEKSQVRKSVRNDEYWQAAETFVISWVGKKGTQATFDVLLTALKDMEWTTLKEAIEKYNWAEIHGMVNTRQEVLEQML